LQSHLGFAAKQDDNLCCGDGPQRKNLQKINSRHHIISRISLHHNESV